MHAPALYLDTSVIGGYFDPEFMADTRALWRLMEAGRFRFRYVTSRHRRNRGRAAAGARIDAQELFARGSAGAHG
jgi:hypothetical protein